MGGSVDSERDVCETSAAAAGEQLGCCAMLKPSAAHVHTRIPTPAPMPAHLRLDWSFMAVAATLRAFIARSSSAPTRSAWLTSTYSRCVTLVVAPPAPPPRAGSSCCTTCFLPAGGPLPSRSRISSL